MEKKKSITESRAYNIAFGVLTTAMVYLFAYAVDLDLQALSAATIGLGLAFALDIKYARASESTKAIWLPRLVGIISTALVANGI